MRGLKAHLLLAFGIYVLLLPLSSAQKISVLYDFGSGSQDPLVQPSYSGIIAQGRDGNRIARRRTPSRATAPLSASPQMERSQWFIASPLAHQVQLLTVVWCLEQTVIFMAQRKAAVTAMELCSSSPRMGN